MTLRAQVKTLRPTPYETLYKRGVLMVRLHGRGHSAGHFFYLAAIERGVRVGIVAPGGRETSLPLHGREGKLGHAVLHLLQALQELG